MSYEYLKKLYGEDAGRAMTYDELVSALDQTKDIQIVDLKAGGYVSIDKFDAKNTELAGTKKQLDDANAQIQSFKGKDVDIEAINQKVSEWEQRYNADTQSLRDQLANQARSHAEDMFMSSYKFTSTPARNGVLEAFRAQKFTLDDDGTFKGGKEYIESLKKQDDYKGAFVQEEAPKEEAKEQPGRFGGTPPRFVDTSNGGTENDNTGNPLLAGLGVTRLHQPTQKLSDDSRI